MSSQVVEPTWLPIDLVKAFHAEGLARFGGLDGVRDAGGLAAALDRPRNKFTDGETRLPALAAAYAFGIAKSHPFIDGNKRAALASIFVFLGLNGATFKPDKLIAVITIENLAAGAFSEAELAAWVSTCVTEPIK